MRAEGSSGMEAVSGANRTLATEGRLRKVSRNAWNSVAAPAPTAPVNTIASKPAGTTGICFPTAPQPRGDGRFSISRVRSFATSRSGLKRRNAISSAGSCDFTAHAAQASTFGTSSTMVANRDFTGSRMPDTPALSVRRFVAAKNVTCSGSLCSPMRRASSSCILAA